MAAEILRLDPSHADRRRLRILLTGPTGQVGWELSRTLQGLGDVVAPGRAASRPLDLTQPDSLRAWVREVRPDVIVNAAAYTAVDKAEQETELALAINGTAPGVLADEARRIGAALVHYSTDYVFPGDGERPWKEDDPTGPLNAYGRSKLAGEEAVRASGCAHLILRVCWVHGVHGANFVKTMLRLGAERPTLSVVADQFGAPTSARVIADITGQILAQGLSHPSGFLRECGGTVHLACGGVTHWQEFAREIFRLAAARGVPLAVTEVKPIPSSAYPTPAVRPKNSRMDCTRLAERFGIVPPDWQTALDHCLDGMIRPAITPAAAPAKPEPCRVRETHPVAGQGCVSRTLPGAVADLDIGVIYTHEREWMDRLVPTLGQSGNDLALRLILVDNASADGTTQWESIIPQTTRLRNAERLGYAPNLNRILEASRAPFVLLLNTDMTFDPPEQCLSKMVRFLRENPECGVAGCRLYHRDGSYGYPARRFQTLPTIAGRRTPLSPLLRPTVDRYLYKDRSKMDTFECDWLSGCFLMVRRQAYEQVGGFDCHFTKYFEDVDWCLRMARAGWRVMFHGGTYCYHGEQRSSGQVFSRDAMRHLRSYYRWIAKWGLSPQRALDSRRAA